MGKCNVGLGSTPTINPGIGPGIDPDVVGDQISLCPLRKLSRRRV